MIKNKNKVALLSSAAIGTLIATALSTTAYAATDAILTKNDNGDIIEYSYEDLKNAAEDAIIDGNSELLDKFISQITVGVHDSLNGYIDFNSIKDAAEVSEIDGTEFNLDNFTEKEVSIDDKMQLPKEIKVVKVNKDGLIKEETKKLDTVDTEAPVISCKGSTEVTIENGAEFKAPEITVVDNVDKDIVATKVIKNAEGKELKVIDTKVAGTYTITYTAKDKAGNEAKSVVITVNVKAVKAELKVESVSAINATTVEVKLAEALKEAPKAEQFAVKANGTDVKVEKAEKVASDLTGKTYKLTVATLKGQQGSLSVNGVESKVKAGQEFAFDYAAPEVKDIAVKGNKTIVVTFSEKLDKATAVKGNVKVGKLGTAGHEPEEAVLNATGTKLTLTLADANKLVPAKYVLVVGNVANTIKDVAGNPIYVGTETIFEPQASELEEKVAPSVVGAKYDNVRGTITLTYDKTGVVTDVTKLAVNTVKLTAADVATPNSNVTTIKLSDDTKKAINALKGELKLVASKEAYTDGTNPTKGQEVSIAKVTPAVISSAAYNQETNVLTLTFDQAVKIDGSNGTDGQSKLKNIKISDKEGTDVAVATGAKLQVEKEIKDFPALKDQKGQAVWNLKLTDGEASKLEANAISKDKIKVYVDAEIVSNAIDKDILNAKTEYKTGAVVAYTADTIKPYVKSISYNDQDKKMTFTFNEELGVKKDGSNIKVGTSEKVADSFTLNASTDLHVDGKDKTTYTATISAGNLTKLTDLYESGKEIKVWFDKEVFTDTDNLKNDKLTFETGVKLDYKDFTAPVLTQVDNTNHKEVKVLTKNVIEIKFNEPMNKETVNTVANYKIKDTREKDLKIEKVELQSDSKTVYIYTEDQQSAMPYKLSIENVKDVQGNIVDDKNKWDNKFIGSGAVIEGKLGFVNPNAITATSKVNTNDTIELTFTANLDQTLANNIANYAVLEAKTNDETGWKEASAVSLSDAKVKVEGAKVTITLGNAHLQDGKFCKVVVSNLTDIYGNALNADKSSAVTVAKVTSPLAKPSVMLSDVKEGAIKLTFDSKLVASQAQNPANWTIKDTANANKMYTATKAVYNWNEKTQKATITLDLSEALKSTSTLDITSNKVTNLAGAKMAPVTGATGIADITAPTIKSIEAAPVKALNDDTIKIVFSEELDKTSAENNKNYVVKVNGETLDLSKLTDDKQVSLSNDTVTITLNTENNDVAYNLHQGDKVEVTVSNVMDKAHNPIKVVTASDIVDSGDKTAPVLSEVKGTKNTDTIELTFDKIVDKTTISKNTFVVTDNNGVQYHVNNAIVTGDKKVTLYLAHKLEAGTDDKTVTVKLAENESVSDMAGNKATSLDESKNSFEIAKKAGDAHVDAKPAVKTADDDLGSSVALETATKIVLNGKDVTLTKVKELGANYDAVTNKATLATTLLGDINEVATLKDKFTVTVKGNKLVISSVETGVATTVDLTGSDVATGATLLGFTTLDAVNGIDAAN